MSKKITRRQGLLGFLGLGAAAIPLAGLAKDESNSKTEAEKLLASETERLKEELRLLKADKSKSSSFWDYPCGDFPRHNGCPGSDIIFSMNVQPTDYVDLPDYPG